MAGGLTLGERLRLAVIEVDRKRRAALATIRRSPVVAWRSGSPRADQMLILPPDVRVADPSFISELADGQLGLAGAVADISGGDVYSVVPPSSAWARELHGFAWLRHLRLSQEPESRQRARRLVLDWIAQHPTPRGIAWETAVVARRALSWMTHAGFLLDETSTEDYARLTDSLGRQIMHLGASWPDAPPGYPRLLALIALVTADLCISGHDRRIGRDVRALSAELGHQVLPDGGHVTRNPDVLVELLLDLVPLRQCFIVRQRAVPAAVAAAIRRARGMLAHLRLGNGSIARFNGMGTTSPEAVATIFSHDEPAEPGSVDCNGPSGYMRIAGGGSVVIMDAGPPPPLSLAGSARAGCLSFEWSSGTSLIVVNCGAPGAAHRSWHAASRSTSSHSTLCLGDKSSSKLVRAPSLERDGSQAPIRFPDRVTRRVLADGGGMAIEASHNGYVRRFGLIHTRRIAISQDGTRLAGSDRLSGERRTVRLKRDAPFAIHFHLHPLIRCVAGPAPNSADLSDGQRQHWRMTADGATLSIEDSVFLAQAGGPRPTRQIVLRGACAGESIVRWSLEMVGGDGADVRLAAALASVEQAMDMFAEVTEKQPVPRPPGTTKDAPT